MAEHDNIRRLDHADPGISRDIWALLRRAYRIEAEILGAGRFPPLGRTVEEIRTANSEFTGLFVDDGLAAVAETRMDGGCLSIDSFVVEPKYFRRGLGSELLGYVLGATRCNATRVETGSANESAIRFYESFGFSETDRWETGSGMTLVRLVRG